MFFRPELKWMFRRSAEMCFFPTLWISNVYLHANVYFCIYFVYTSLFMYVHWFMYAPLSIYIFVSFMSTILYIYVFMYYNIFWIVYMTMQNHNDSPIEMKIFMYMLYMLCHNVIIVSPLGAESRSRASARAAYSTGTRVKTTRWSVLRDSGYFGVHLQEEADTEP